MEKSTAIQFKQVTKQFHENGTKALEDVSFEIKEGEFITILGSSGSGKTTLLKMINRLIEPDTGVIEYYGKNIEEIELTQLRRQMGYVVQQIALFPHLTVAQNIATVPELLHWDKQKIKDRVTELLQLVQLPPAEFYGRLPKELSGGQQQRVGVARALAAYPKIMLLDEPFGALDAITRTGLQAELKRIHQQLEGQTFIFVTHDVKEAFSLGTKVLIMDRGKVCQFDTPANIFKNPETGFVKNLMDTIKKETQFWEGIS